MIGTDGAALVVEWGNSTIQPDQLPLVSRALIFTPARGTWLYRGRRFCPRHRQRAVGAIVTSLPGDFLIRAPLAFWLALGPVAVGPPHWLRYTAVILPDAVWFRHPCWRRSWFIDRRPL